MGQGDVSFVQAVVDAALAEAVGLCQPGDTLVAKVAPFQEVSLFSPPPVPQRGQRRSDRLPQGIGPGQPGISRQAALDVCQAVGQGRIAQRRPVPALECGAQVAQQLRIIPALVGHSPLLEFGAGTKPVHLNYTRSLVRLTRGELRTGRLTDRWGRGPVILSGAGLLVLACTLATLAPGVLPLSAALFLLGLGWNFCYVGGSTLLSDQLSHAEGAKTQGANEWLLGLATAAASLGSGLVFALTSFTAIGMLGAVLALVPLGLTGWWVVWGQRLAVA